MLLGISPELICFFQRRGRSQNHDTWLEMDTLENSDQRWRVLRKKGAPRNPFRATQETLVSGDSSIHANKQLYIYIYMVPTMDSNVMVVRFASKYQQTLVFHTTKEFVEVTCLAPTISEAHTAPGLLLENEDRGGHQHLFAAEGVRSQVLGGGKPEKANPKTGKPHASPFSSVCSGKIALGGNQKREARGKLK